MGLLDPTTPGGASVGRPRWQSTFAASRPKEHWFTEEQARSIIGESPAEIAFNFALSPARLPRLAGGLLAAGLASDDAQAGWRGEIMKKARGLFGLGGPSGKIETTQASRSPHIYDPTPTPQRPFHDDYPQGVAGPDGSRLLADIEGRPLSAQYIAGRRVGGGVDEGLGGGDTHGIAGSLGITKNLRPRTGPDLKGDAGRFVESGGKRDIYVDQKLAPEQAGRVFEHELAHGIDSLVFGQRIPVGGLKKELATVYEDLNTGMRFKPGRGATPEGQNYTAAAADAERMAEAIRAYMRDPNYLKTVAPKTAARIREYVNANPNLNKTIQFNSIGAGGLLGAALVDEPPR